MTSTPMRALLPLLLLVAASVGGGLQLSGRGGDGRVVSIDTSDDVGDGKGVEVDGAEGNNNRNISNDRSSPMQRRRRVSGVSVGGNKRGSGGSGGGGGGSSESSLVGRCRLTQGFRS